MTDERGDHSELREQMKLGGQAGEAPVHLGGRSGGCHRAAGAPTGQVSERLAEFLARTLGCYYNYYDIIEEVAEVFAAPDGGARLGNAIAEARGAAPIKEQHEGLVDEIATLIRDSEEYAEALFNAAKRRARPPAHQRGKSPSGLPGSWPAISKTKMMTTSFEISPKSSPRRTVGRA